MSDKPKKKKSIKKTETKSSIKKSETKSSKKGKDSKSKDKYISVIYLKKIPFLKRRKKNLL